MHGFGDSGGSFMSKFQEALVRGELLFWLFPKNSLTVWQVGMVPPFDWDLKAHLPLLCIENQSALKFPDEESSYIVGNCSTCSDPRTSATTTTMLQRKQGNADRLDVHLKTLF
jgi:hypothetical protein